MPHSRLRAVSLGIITACVTGPSQAEVYGLQGVEVEGRVHLISADIQTPQGAAAAVEHYCRVAMAPWIRKLSRVSMTLPQQLGWFH